MKILKRFIYILQTPLFFLYMCLPVFWIIDLPYWIITGKSLMKDWCKYNEI